MKLFDDGTKDGGKSFKRRAFLLGVGQASLLSALGFRLYDLQIKQAQDFALRAEQNRINLQMLPPVRGLIFDRFGRPVARNTDNLSIVIIPDLAGDLSAVLNHLSRLVYISQETMKRVLTLARAQPQYVPILVREGLSWKSYSEVNVLAPQLPGVQTINLPQRHYDAGESLSHITGYVGRGNKEEIGRNPILRLPGMRIGKTGIEFSQNTILSGTHGVQKLEVNAKGHLVRMLDQTKAKAGRPLYLSIDRDLQAKVMSQLQPLQRACVVVTKVATGEVMVMASFPSFNANKLIVKDNRAYWNGLRTNQASPLINRAIQGRYPPGSTFKMVTALAALDAGLVTPKETINCSGSYQLGGKSFGCWKRRGHGAVQLHSALVQSCDVYFYELAHRLGINAIAAMARKLGLGQKYDMGLGHQNAGVIPTSKWKRETLKQSWYGGETLHAGIGQGYVLTTPLQLSVMSARLATGKKVIPTLMKVDKEQPLFAPLDIDPKHLALVRRAMYGVVNEKKGTAFRARDSFDGHAMSGKTGTAQVSGRSRHVAHEDLQWRYRDHALFVGFAPSKTPQYAISTIVEHGGNGSSTAAPLVRDVMHWVMEAEKKGGASLPSDQLLNQKTAFEEAQ